MTRHSRRVLWLTYRERVSGSPHPARPEVCCIPRRHQQPEKKGLIQEGNPAGWEMAPSTRSLAPFPASLNFYCLQPCDSGLPDLGSCQPCTEQGLLLTCLPVTGAARLLMLDPVLFPQTGLPCGCTPGMLLARLQIPLGHHHGPYGCACLVPGP